MKMKALILCKSPHHQNTRLVANAMADELQAEVIDPDEWMGGTVGDYQLLGLGSGIYYGRFHAAVRNWIARLPEGAGTGHRVFVFSTSGLPFLSKVYHAPLRACLRGKGFQIAGDFACRGHDTFAFLKWVGGLNRNHPNERDLERARAFASHLKASHR
ncbi:Flavodoxin [Neorhodopirellula lusitana]|uniref:Flavodoxin n=1 Tax=Neorhodopirellula lusitana TaxID=445327 RepID=A0ABY1PQM3_9BACT|nr:flavodoxin family protein [Neorhodopirellula lusitana]SMP42730.1 Flavodoxin [Neorhodopirellula lusitana]